MHLDSTHPQNIKVLQYLSQARPQVPELALRNSVDNPYYHCGCHPEIVERLWDQIGAALPPDCCVLVFGVPALVQPVSGIVLGIGMGTQYGLHLPAPLAAVAVKAGAHTTTTWAGGHSTDIQKTFGADWVFGAWLKDELAWCNSAYALLANAD